MKLTLDIQVYHRMFHVEIGVHGTNDSCTKTDLIQLYHALWYFQFFPELRFSGHR